MADVRCSADGKGVGHGTMLIRMERVLRFGQAMGVPVLFVRTARSINTAIFHLQSDDVAIISPASWRAVWLKWVWFATAPVPHRVAVAVGAAYGRTSAVGARLRRCRALSVPAASGSALRPATATPVSQASGGQCRLRVTRLGVMATEVQAAGKQTASNRGAQGDSNAPATDATRRPRACGDRRGGRAGHQPDNARGDGPRSRVQVSVGRRSPPEKLGCLTECAGRDLFRGVQRPCRAWLHGRPPRRSHDDSRPAIWRHRSRDLTSKDRVARDLVHAAQRFFIGCDSGPSWLASLLEVPILTG